MSEKLYSIKESTMTNMADTIRQITGTTGPITGEEVSDYVVANLPNSENLDEVLEDQDDIIAQIQTMLQGKAAGGGEPVLQDKTITPTTSKQIVTADGGYDGLDTVTVNAIPSNYEDVGTETNAYTTKLASLESAITALETELEGKASGGSGSGFESNTDVCNISIISDYRTEAVCYYSSEGHTVQNEYQKKYNISAICGSVVYIVQTGLYSAMASAGEILQTEWGQGLTYRVPSTPMNITISIVTD